MSRSANPVVVGAFVIGALVLIVVGVLVFGGGALLREPFTVVAFFSGDVQGLQEGSAVEFRGVRVGTVSRIRLVLDVQSKELRIPVFMELDPRRLTLSGRNLDDSRDDPGAFLDELVANGLRARLDLKSFVTGQLVVGLDMRPNTQAVRVGAIPDAYELPTVPSTLDRVTKLFQNLPLQDIASKLISTLERVDRMMSDKHLAAALRDASGTMAEARRLMTDLQANVGPVLEETRAALREVRASLARTGGRADATLDEYAKLAKVAGTRLQTLATRLERTLDELAGVRSTVDARVAPLASSALDTLAEAKGAFSNARALLADDSRTRYNLDVTLEELAATARSLRIMVDYLEQNPDALIKGKRR